MLSNDIKRVLELDGKRTQGKWWVDDDTHVQCSLNGCADIVEPCECGEYRPEFLTDDDAGFVAAAPLMASIIRQQNELLREAYHALWVAHENSKLHNGENYNVTIQTGATLSKIKTALGDV